MKQKTDELGEMRSELIFERALLDNEGSEASVNPDLAAELRELAVELEAFCNQCETRSARPKKGCVASSRGEAKLSRKSAEAG